MRRGTGARARLRSNGHAYPSSPTSRLCRAVVGFVLALIGGGGSILAVPLLVYVVGVASPHVAIGTSAMAVAVSALPT